ncbi:MAG: dihydroneopterin aldolase family protein [archaeon]|nr:dihydroneopterin aldolase family protein [archaeon]MCP8314817.1 dihydroneopterin aldolase family protein [archaeon]MCP8321178.1 dihydroneopterin aldolase family protein [archaeon]
MESIEEVVRRYFDKSVTNRERVIFEGAIALGAIYHQFIGIPICKDEDIIRTLEETISRTMKLQPYRESVEVRIDADMIKGEKSHAYDYETLKGKHLDVKVKTKYGNAKATVRMRYIPEIDFTLMYIEKLEEI